MNLRTYQQAAVDHCVEFATSRPAGSRLMLASPTGTGKSVIELALQARLGADACSIVTPRLEIVAGMLAKRGEDVPAAEAKLAARGQDHGIWTPLRLRNALMAGRQKAPRVLLLDEGHHDIASSWQDLHLLCGACTAIAFTATPFRGTPRGTVALREVWGEPTWVITAREAAALGHYAMPACSVEPLVDDDLIEVVNGELVATQVGEATTARLDALAAMAGGYYDMGEARWTRPTMISMPSRDTAAAMMDRLCRAGFPAFAVTALTPRKARVAAFEDTVSRKIALIQINVVSEGVDLPIRRLIDASPMLSPVRWLQMFGRVTRPSDAAPEYVCTNRNLIRHGYLLDGLLPSAAMKQAQDAFGGPGARAAARAVGLEALGRLKGAELPLMGGLKALCYAVSAPTDGATIDYCVIVHPCREGALWATRTRAGQEYGRWGRCEPPADLAGFASVNPSPMSEKQEAWWRRCAGNVGLDPDAAVTRKVFQALPVLSDLRARL